MDSPGPQQSQFDIFELTWIQGYERAFWSQIQKSELFSQNATIWVSMDSPGPQQSQFDIFELTLTSRVRKGLLAPNSKICTFVTKPHNMSVCGLPWTSAVTI